MLDLNEIERHIDDWVDPRSKTFGYMWAMVHEIERLLRENKTLTNDNEALVGERRYLLAIEKMAREMMKKNDVLAEAIDAGGGSSDIGALMHEYDLSLDDLETALMEYDWIMNAPESETCNAE